MLSLFVTTDVNTETIESFGEFINRYGFMVLFSTIVLIILTILFINHEKVSMKKQESELEALNKERNANLEQNSKMFDLVTRVQTEQVVQLQQMTTSLRDIHRNIKDTEIRIIQTTENFEKIKLSLDNHDEHAIQIIDTLGEILEYVKNTEAYNKEIIAKISIIEESLLKD